MMLGERTATLLAGQVVSLKADLIPSINDYK